MNVFYPFFGKKLLLLFSQSKKNSHEIFFSTEKEKFFRFWKFFSKKIEKKWKKPKKSTFSENAPWREFRVSGAVFLWKGGTLSIYLGGGVTPIFRSILRIGTPFFGGLFLTLFFEFFLEKKIFSGQKIFFELKKFKKFFQQSKKKSLVRKIFFFKVRTLKKKPQNDDRGVPSKSHRFRGSSRLDFPRFWTSAKDRTRQPEEFIV